MATASLLKGALEEAWAASAMLRRKAFDLEHDLLDRLNATRAELREEYLRPGDHPWIVGFSGGKDSTLVLHLVLEMLLAFPPSRRTREVHVVSNDTRVESPIVNDFVDGVLERIERAIPALQVPVKVVKTLPDVSESFWVNLIGRGYPAPNRNFRWCTDRMKIRPTTRYIQSLANNPDGVVLLLGVRRLESTARAKVVKRYDTGGRLNDHNDIENCKVFRPIVELSTKEVWMLLLQLRPPWGGSHRDLSTLYRNADDGECPFVTGSEDAPSCGTSSSRFGCWTCTVVEKDRSLRNMIDNGHEDMEPLADFRDWLKDFSVDRANRSMVRRSGAPGIGPLTLEARETVLQRLLQLRSEVDCHVISDEEIDLIQRIWADDRLDESLREARALVQKVRGESK